MSNEHDEEWTCGKGLAHNANLPEQLARVLGAMADLLDAHASTLDLTDETCHQESAAYRALSRGHRALATELSALANEMTGYRELPMCRHDLTAMSRQSEPFANLVRQKQRLLLLLQESADEEQEMLAEMQG